MSAELIVTIVIQVIATIGTLGAALIAAWPKIRSIADDARAVREQTENNHADAPHPNLRDQIDHIQNEMRNGFSSIESRMDAQEYRMDGISERLSAHVSSSAEESGFVQMLMSRTTDLFTKKEEN